MLTFNKINDIQSEILWDGSIIGYLEKPFRTWYKIEVGYMETELPANKSHLVKGLIERIHLNNLSKQKRTFIKEHKLKNSIYNTGREFKVLG